MVSSFISPLTGVNTSNMLVKLNFITGAVQEFVWSVSYPVLILNSWLFQPFQLKFCEMAASRETSRANWEALLAGRRCLRAGTGCRVGSTLLSKLLTATENSVCSGSKLRSAQLEKDLLNEMCVWARERARACGWNSGRACSSKTKLRQLTELAGCSAWCSHKGEFFLKMSNFNKNGLLSKNVVKLSFSKFILSCRFFIFTEKFHCHFR